MCGLLLVPDSVLRSLGVGALTVGLVSVFAALTLVPALLGLLGDKVNALRVPFLGRVVDSAGEEGRVWSGIARAVMRRPVVSLAAVLVVLLVCAAPVLGLRLSGPGIRSFPDSAPSKPRIVALVLGLSFVLLTIAFRSIVLPLKAILLNLLSVGAAYGLLVLVFQDGIGNGILGFSKTPAVTTWVPLFLFTVLFGLSMDYHVFLLSRIRERYLRTGLNEEAVAYAVATTARVITGAALIIIAVFVGFASGQIAEIQQVGFGVGIALLIDATVVRCVLVPASMKLLGRWNWYLPSWLGWLPDPHVEHEAVRP